MLLHNYLPADPDDHQNDSSPLTSLQLLLFSLRLLQRCRRRPLKVRLDQNKDQCCPQTDYRATLIIGEFDRFRPLKHVDESCYPRIANRREWIQVLFTQVWVYKCITLEIKKGKHKRTFYL
jgi:hypothetical protein